ncbi:MAG TPA: hypothetical protein IGS52_18890 [Oscillatoriaceae cyanobacterium M33_DOE_052]|uniref:Uncharacterized protein n=1 Tax=Planktothricoides sp. SpSt-374 TaxID=2282167 RepID=A0A7C3ZJ38_9CYAN|nr:hypothetical protein [Oscillatoriaceae cyanobacterium M33_DOE_052]
MNVNSHLLRLSFFSSLVSLVLLDPSPSLANADLLTGVKPASGSATLPISDTTATPISDTIPTLAFQAQGAIYTREQLSQLLLVLREIDNLRLRREQTEEIQALIKDLEQLQARGRAEVQLSPPQTEQIAKLLESLTPEEIQRIDQALQQPQVQVALLSQQELQDLLSLFRQIQEQQLRPRQTEEIQSLIEYLERLQAEKPEGEVILSTDRAEEIQRIVDSLTPAERESLGDSRESLLGIPKRLNPEQMEQLLLVMREIQKLDLNQAQNQQVTSIIADLEQLQSRGDAEVELTTAQLDQIDNLVQSLTPAQFDQLSRALPETEARVFTAEEFDRLVRIFRAAEELELDSAQAEEVQKWLRVLEARQAEEQELYLLTGDQVAALENILNSFNQSQLRKIGRAIGGVGVSPSVSILTPVGFGGYYGNASAGIVFVHRTRFTRKADASFSASVGLGDPETYLGLDASVAVTGLSDDVGEQDNFGGGSISFQVSRTLPNNFGIGAGMQNIIRWRSGASDNGASTYVVLSKIQPLKQDLSQPLSLAYFSVGLGNGIYRSEDDFTPDDDLGGTPFNFFGSFAVNLRENINGIVEWTGQDLSLGMSIIPIKDVPLVFTPSFIDVTGTAGDGVRFNASLVYSIAF